MGDQRKHDFVIVICIYCLYDARKTGELVSKTVSLYNISRCVRIPKHLLEYLEKESEQTGIGVTSTMARFVLVTRLRSGNIEPLADVIEKIPYNADQEQRVNIFLSEELVGLTNHASDLVANGKFSKLVVGVLTERYAKEGTYQQGRPI